MSAAPDEADGDAAASDAAADGDGLGLPRERETVTQTLAVVQAYTGAGSKVRSADDDGPANDDGAASPHDAEVAPAPAAAAVRPGSATEPSRGAPAGVDPRRWRGIDLRLLVIALVVGLAVSGLVLLLQRL